MEGGTLHCTNLGLTLDTTATSRMSTFSPTSIPRNWIDFLTSSEDEMRRLNVMHWGMRELWQTSVRVPLPHPSVHILDVGCGTGIWAKEVAEALASSRVVAVDLSPVFWPDTPERPAPPNLFFEVYTVRSGVA
jgi:SAM-dependent methyltransferase